MVEEIWMELLETNRKLDALLTAFQHIAALVAQPQGEAATGRQERLHPKTAEAMNRHAPEMTAEEMTDILNRFWSRHTVHRNTNCYANLMPADNFPEQQKMAARHIYWLKRAQKIEYDYKFKCLRKCGN